MADKKDALAGQGSTALAANLDQAPAFIPQGQITGAENISPDDARIPRLVLAQPGSPQVMAGDPNFIEGLTAGMSFNDLTMEVYGRDPVQIIVVRADKPRWVQFSKDDRKVVVDPSVKWGDPRTQFHDDPENPGKRLPPEATCFFDYVVLLGNKLEPLAWSVKSSGIKATVKPLNGMIKAKTVPLYACVYQLAPTMMKNDAGTWYIYKAKPLGFIQNEQTYRQAEAAFKQFAEKRVEFDQAAPKDDAFVDPDAPGAEHEPEV